MAHSKDAQCSLLISLYSCRLLLGSSKQKQLAATVTAMQSHQRRRRKGNEIEGRANTKSQSAAEVVEQRHFSAICCNEGLCSQSGQKALIQYISAYSILFYNIVCHQTWYGYHRLAVSGMLVLIASLVCLRRRGVVHVYSRGFARQGVIAYTQSSRVRFPVNERLWHKIKTADIPSTCVQHYSAAFLWCTPSRCRSALVLVSLLHVRRYGC